MFRLPAYILDALKDCCFMLRRTGGPPSYSREIQELVDLGYVGTRLVSEDDTDFVYLTSISPEGKRALLDNLRSSELVALIQDGIAIGRYKLAAELVAGVPERLLPELLLSNCKAVERAVRGRLERKKR